MLSYLSPHISNLKSQISSPMKLTAFTILEVTIAMLLAGISITITYTAYRMITNSYKQYDEKNKKLAESVLLNKLLKKDFLEAKAVMAENNGLLIKTPSGDIWYDFNSESIIRDQFGLQKDTFFVQPSNLRSYFRNKEVFSGEVVDKAQFGSSLGNLHMENCYSKSYSSEELIQITKTN